MSFDRFLGQRIGAHGARSDGFGRIQVLFHQQRRDGQDVGDIVEAVAGIVGGEILVGAEIDRQQIADGVAVFVAIEPLGDHAAGIGFDQRVGLLELTLEEFHQPIELFRGRTRDFFRRHLAGLNFVDDCVPCSPVAQKGGRIEVGLQIEPAGQESRIVAIGTGVLEDGFDFGIEAGSVHGRFGGRGCSGDGDGDQPGGQNHAEHNPLAVLQSTSPLVHPCLIREANILLSNELDAR